MTFIAWGEGPFSQITEDESKTVKCKSCGELEYADKAWDTKDGKICRACYADKPRNPKSYPTKVNEAVGKKSIHQINVGDKVKGKYLNVPFTGRVTGHRPHTMNHRIELFTVDLDKPIDVFGDKRSSIHFGTSDDLQAAHNFNKTEYGDTTIELNEAAQFNTIQPPLKSLASRQNSVNKFLSELGHEYHAKIPLDDIFKNLRSNGFEPLQEDGTSWSGMLLGRDSHCKIDLQDKADGKVRRYLSLSWHKMDVSGKFEVTAYVS